MIAFLAALIGCRVESPAPQGAIDSQVEALLARMTLTEKVQQLRCVQLGTRVRRNNVFDPAIAEPILKDGIGEIAPMDMDPRAEVPLRNAIQSYLLHNTRLGIPAIFHDEACHGFRDIGATSFPAPIGVACSWDPPMLEQIYTVAAAEMRARGVSQALCPVVDICRDPRWGRTDETLGEDPFLNGKLAAAIVRGLQGTDTGVIAPGHVAATLKHFAGHGQPEAGVNRAPGDIPLREMYDAHLVPFRIAIAEGHPAAIMPAYTEVNGVPAHGNAWLLHDVLRDEFHFPGLVVSDYTGVEYLASVHEVVADNAGAAALALNSGVDVNLPDGRAYANLESLVQQGRVPIATIDNAVRRVLRLKFALNLYNTPYGDADKSVELPTEASSQTLARRAATESIVLLKNRDSILPLAKDKTIAVIGPNADDARLGSYSGEPLYKVSILQGIRAKLGEAGHVLYAEGCKIVTNLPDSSLQAWQRATTPVFPTDQENRDSIAAAVTVARQADVILLVLGENEMFSREAWAANHLGDRSSLDLPGAQNDLADAIFALNKPVIVYLMNGRPLAVPQLVDRANAVLEGWYMGQETGNAAADILFGDANPSGKLTITIPRSVGQIPDYYDAKPSARLYNYVDETTRPLFPFGFGLSYTHFDYSQPVLSSPTMPLDGQVTVSATVSNSGAVAGDEIAEFFIHQKVSSVTRPVKELRGFKRIHLAPGESRAVSFTVNRDTLAFHDIQMNFTDEPGDIDLMIGPSSDLVKKTTLHVTQ